MASKPALAVNGSTDDRPIMLLMIANVGGPSDGRGTASRRKKAIAELLQEHQPNVVLFQEVPWKGIGRSSTWKGIEIPEKYEYLGHTEASILFDKNDLIITKQNEREMRSLLDEMLRTTKLPAGFTPLGRMCVVIVETKGVPRAKFLCVSWHGFRKKKNEDLLDEFKHMQIFVIALGKKQDLPFIIGGDFNISYKEATKAIMHPLVIYNYQPLKRREGKMIDFFIGSDSLKLDDVKPIDWESLQDGENNNRILDHDAVVAKLKKLRG